MADDRDILIHISEWASAGHNIALAFVLKTWGSAPRPVGSLLAICDNGEFQGSVSGGCVENAVIEEAQIIMRTGVPRTLSYGVADETAWELGLPCGGTIEVLALQVSDRALIQRLAQPEPAVFIVNAATGLSARPIWAPFVVGLFLPSLSSLSDDSMLRRRDSRLAAPRTVRTTSLVNITVLSAPEAVLRIMSGRIPSTNRREKPPVSPAEAPPSSGRPVVFSGSPSIVSLPDSP